MSNYFEQCVESDVMYSGRTIHKMACTNFLNDQMNYAIVDYSADVASCQYHQCVIMSDPNTGSRNTLSCSGAVLETAGNFYNAISSLALDTTIARDLPNSLGLPSAFKYYYVKDVRTMYSSTISGLSCSDNFRTSFTVGGNVIVWGNADDITVFHGLSTFLIVFFTGLSIYLLCFLLFGYIIYKDDYTTEGAVKLRMLVLYLILHSTVILALFAFSLSEMYSALLAIGCNFLIILILTFCTNLFKEKQIIFNYFAGGRKQNI